MKKITSIINLKNFYLISLFLLIMIFQNNVFSQSLPPAPGNIIAIPDTITCGVNSALSATAAGNNMVIRWWDASTGGLLIGSSMSGVNYFVIPSSTFTYYAESYNPTTGLSSASRVGITVYVTLLPIPTSVMVYPGSVQCGTAVNFFASTTTGLIRWWDAMTGGNLIGSSLSGVFFNIIPPYSMNFYAESYLANPVSQTFTYTGSVQNYTVPYGVTSLFIDVSGAQGGTYNSTYGTGGLGGRVQTNLTVTSYMTLSFYVGGQGGSHIAGWNGGGTGGTYSGGGGGASDIRINGTALTSRVVVAGGGGGGSGYNTTGCNGGAGGDTIGGNGLNLNSYNATYCGAGGSQSSGGAAATFTGYPSTAGTFGIGGDQSSYYGGGGGGGYYGGGGGSYNGGGGGGSSWVSPSLTSNNIRTQGYQAGNGQIIISYNNYACVSLRTSVNVTVNGNPSNPTVTANPSTIICGGSSTLTGTSSGNIIRWWNASFGGVLLKSTVSGSNFIVTPTVTTTYYAESFLSPCVSQRVSIIVVINAITPPTSVISSPSSVMCSGSVNLSAVSTGNIIRWWDNSIGGNMFGSTISSGNINISPTITTYYYAEAYNPCSISTRTSVLVTVTPLLPPTQVTAVPNNLVCGGPTNLYALTLTGTIRWWNSGSGGNFIGSTTSGSTLTISPPYGSSTYYAEAATNGIFSQSFNYSGSIVNWTVPSGIFQVNIEARGASGGYNYSGTGGRGARMIGTFSVAPGNVLSILVGQSPGQAASNYLPGGGGGTFVALGSSYTTATPMIVAGGGGGGYSSYAGVDAPTTQAGTYSSGQNYLGPNGYGAISADCTGGGGGFYSSGGADLDNHFSGGGGFHQGGSGGCASNGASMSYQCGGFGGGTAADEEMMCMISAGNGGGYSGGSGEDDNSYNEYGQAGGSYNCGTNQINFSGTSGNTGNGMVVISWNTNPCISLRVSVSVTVSGTVSISSASANPSTVTCDTSSTLNAVSPGATIKWWDAPSGGNLLSSTTSGVNFMVYPISTTKYYAEAFFYPCTSFPRTSVTVTVNQISSPTSLFAIPTTVNCGASTNLNATTTNGIIRWWDASAGGNYIGTSQSQSFLNTVPIISTTYYAESYLSFLNNLFQIFNFSGAYSTFTVPSGVTSINVDARGAMGYAAGYSTGGLGGRVQTFLSVTPGQLLYIFVGGAGTGYNTGGWNGGATGFAVGNSGNGGGATDIRIGNINLNNRVIVAGGGGGGGYYCGNDNGGEGGGLTGNNGLACGTYNSYYCGAGGTQSSGGIGASGGGNTGTIGIGGASTSAFGGGGGGGYYGGGSGFNGGGGGGSGYAGAGTSNTVFTSGFQSGDGQLIVSWIGNSVCLSQRVAMSTPVIVTTNLTTPTSLIANPATLSCGGNSNLSGTSSGNMIRWWNSPSGGTMLGSSLSGFFFPVYPSVTTTYYAESFNVCVSPTRSSVTVNVNPLATPTSISATPSVLCANGISNLIATSAGDSIDWWTAATGGTLLGNSASGVNFQVSPTVTTTYYADANSAFSGSQTFTFSLSGYQTFTVPFGVTSIAVDVAGAAGGGSAYSQPGLGGRVQANLYVTAGQILNLFVGGAGVSGTTTAGGLGGWNGGANGGYANSSYKGAGGGGASDIRVGGILYSNVVIVAGGGGGVAGSYSNCNGGTGGGISGGNGLYMGNQSTIYAGQGGTQTTGGAGATNGPGQSGTLGNGGAGYATGSGGGGGGGYFGGGGGNTGGGGGGGSGYAGAGTTNVIQTTGYQSGNGQISISWNSSGCTSTRVSVTVTISSNSTTATSATATPSTINSGSSSTLSKIGGSLGAGANWYWYTVSCGGTFVGSGASKVQSPTTTTVYYVRAESACNTTLCVSTTITVSSSSVSANSAIVTPSMICPGSPATLSLSGGSLGAGANWYWYTGSCGGTYVISGVSPVLYPTVTTTYFVRAQGNLNTTGCVSVTVTLSTLSAPPTSATGTSPICPGATTTLGFTGGNLGAGATWLWFTSSCGATYISSGISPVLTPTITTTYYVLAEGTCNTTTCANFTVILNSISTVPTSVAASPTSICNGSTSTITETGGFLGTNAMWVWYTISCGGTNAGSGVSVIESPSITTSYWIRAEGLCNTTGCKSITLSILQNSTAASTATAYYSTICSGTTDSLYATGGTLSTGANWFWYKGTCGGTKIGTGNPLAIVPVITDTFFVRAEGTCNTTLCVNTTINVSASPIAPTWAATDRNNFCSNSGGNITLSISGGSGTTLMWYKSSCGGTLVGSGNPKIIPIPMMTTTYYARWQIQGCNNSACVSITVVELSSPTTPVSFSYTPNNLCSNTGGTIILSGSGGAGTTLGWYTGNCGVSGIGTGRNLTIPAPTNTTVYWGRMETVSCGNSNCKSMTVIVNTLSSPADSVSAIGTTVCSGIPVSLSVSGGALGSGANWNWYAGSCSGTYIISGFLIIQSPSVTTNYYLKAEGPCNTTSCVSKTIKVNNVPSQPSQITGNSNPQIGNSELYYVTNDSNATSYLWTYPSGWTGFSSTNSITCYIGTGSGILTVIPSNYCGAGLARTFSVGSFSLNGKFYYCNSTNPLDSIWVYLMQNGNKIDSVMTDTNGYYQFNGVPVGTYNINVITNKPWSGVNATDAVKVKRHFAGSELLTSSILLHAADVNLSYNINTTDAVKITRRFVGTDTSFARGDWLFEKPLGGDTINVSVYMDDTVIINGSNITQNFYGVCVGDVNASNSPPFKYTSKIYLDYYDFNDYHDLMRLNSNELFELPIITTYDLNVGAISLILKYPKNIVKVNSCQLSAGYETEGLWYNIIGDELRIGWYENETPINLKKNESLIIIKGQTTSDFKLGDVIKFSIANNPLCEIADENGNPKDNVVLKTYIIEHSDNVSAESFYNISANDLAIYPNPANNTVNIKYNVYKDGFVKIALYNVLGEKVMDIFNNSVLKGTYNSEIDLTAIEEGVYLCKMIFDGNDVIVKKVVISK